MNELLNQESRLLGTKSLHKNENKKKNTKRNQVKPENSMYVTVIINKLIKCCNMRFFFLFVASKLLYFRDARRISFYSLTKAIHVCLIIL